MKVILQIATTANGFIGLPDGTSSWVNLEYEDFLNTVNSIGIIVMGKNTYLANANDFPIGSALNIVMTKDKDLHKESTTAIFTDKTPKEIIELANEKGFKELLIVGGKEAASSFLREDLIDEIKLDVHPLFFCDGMELFSKTLGTKIKKMKLISTKELGFDIVQLHYQLVKD